MRKKNLLTFITLSRLFVLPGLIFCLPLSTFKSNLLSFLLLSLIGLSDVADGFLARRWQETSDFGTILDALIDKITSITLVVLFILFKKFPLVLGIFLVSKDFLMVAGGWSLWRKDKKMIVPSVYGKILGLVFFATLTIYIWEVEWLKTPLLLLLVSFSLLSFISPLFKNLHRL